MGIVLLFGGFIRLIMMFFSDCVIFLLDLNRDIFWWVGECVGKLVGKYGWLRVFFFENSGNVVEELFGCIKSLILKEFCMVIMYN